MGLLLAQVKVPVGATYFPKEIGLTPRAFVFSFRACFCLFNLRTSCRFLRSKSNVVFESEHDNGGHFGAYEQPEALVGDLRKMFGKGGPAAGVVPGHNGF